MWFVLVTGLASSSDIWSVLPPPRRREGSPSARGARGAPSPADPGRTMGALGLARAAFEAVFQGEQLLFWLFGYVSPLACLC